jgi:hypothetical protein
MVVHSCNPSYLGSQGRKITSSRFARQNSSETQSQKTIDLGVQHLPSMCKALGSIPGTFTFQDSESLTLEIVACFIFYEEVRRKV